jgi:hypothetical protein
MRDRTSYIGGLRTCTASGCRAPSLVPLLGPSFWQLPLGLRVPALSPHSHTQPTTDCAKAVLRQTEPGSVITSQHRRHSLVMRRSGVRFPEAALSSLRQSLRPRLLATSTRWAATPPGNTSAALRGDGDRIYLDGLERDFRTRTLDAGPTPSRRPVVDHESPRRGRANVQTSVPPASTPAFARDHGFQSVASRSARAASMAMAASGRSSRMACSSAPLRISPRTPSGPAVTLAARGWPRSSESSPT